MLNWLRSLLPIARNAKITDLAAVTDSSLSPSPGSLRDDGAGKIRGNAFLSQGKFKEAAACYMQTLGDSPGDTEALDSLTNALKFQGNPDAATEYYKRVAALTQNDARVHVAFGNMFKDMGEREASIQSYSQAIMLDSDCAEAYFNQATIFFEQGLLKAAAENYRRVISLMPDFVDAYLNLGSALQNTGDLDAAIAAYQKALLIKADYPEVHSNIGFILQAQGKSDAAVDSCQRALSINPDLANAHVNIGLAFQGQGRLEKALEHYRRALALQPDFPLVHSNLLFVLSFFSKCSPAEYIAEARRYGRNVVAKARPYLQWQTGATGDTLQRPLRVGVVSGDMRIHPAGFFLESILAHLNSARVALVAYSTLSRDDALTARIKPAFADWHSIAGVSDEAAARKIHSDRIDILIDLAGHTEHNRLPLFAWKPAPVQVSWLGYWASTGVPGMDYLLADAISVPESNRAHFTETVWYLPDTRLCFTPPASSLRVAPLPALRNGYVTFGSFQNTTKITDAVLTLWCRILFAMPEARLRLQSKQLADAAARDHLLQRLARAGIGSQCVTIVGAMPREEYLAAHGDVDIILDTFPFPGGTTTCEALWMGVPTLTRTGDTLLGCQGVSMMTCAGLGDWVAIDEDDYVEKTLAHARDFDRLAQLRAGLREQVLASPLFDAPRFARHLEDALQGIWKEKGAAS
jgi:protein O-GlcNAc transferase